MPRFYEYITLPMPAKAVVRLQERRTIEPYNKFIYNGCKRIQPAGKMEILELLEAVEIFDGLSQQERLQIAAICTLVEIKKGEKITVQDSEGDDLFIIAAGFVEVNVKLRDGSPKSIVNLGPGQIIGEMALIDRGPRSATVVALSQPTILYRITHQDFETLCSQNAKIGYIVIRNLAIDLSFKLRHQNLQNQ